MNRNRQSNKRRTRGSRQSGNMVRNRRRGLQQAGTAHTFLPYSGPSFTTLMPREFSVALRSRDIYQLDNQTMVNTIRRPLMEFNGASPANMAEMYNLYKYCRVTATSIVYQVINTGSTSISIAMAPVPWSQTTNSMNTVNLSEMPGGRIQLVGGSGGFNKATLRFSSRADRLLGTPNYVDKYWITLAQAGTSGTPVDNEEPTLCFSVGSSAATYSATLLVEQTWHCQFFDVAKTQ